jgi:hypothetical protein
MEKKPAAAEPATSPEEIQEMFGQAVLMGLLALVFFAITYSCFVWKQNKELLDQLSQLTPQAQQARDMEGVYQNFVNDLSAYSRQHPDVVQVLMRSGIEVSQTPPPPSIPGELPPMPAPPPARQ